MKFEIIKTRFL